MRSARPYPGTQAALRAIRAEEVCVVDLVTTRDQIVENLRVFHGYRSDPQKR